MTTPRVTIVATCPNGHETFMFPENCTKIDFNKEKVDTIIFYWDCPVCPATNYKHEVEVCPT